MTFTIKPYWINDVTRLNAQNFNNILYSSMKTNIQAAVNNGYSDTNNELKNILTILPGFKVSDTSTSEIHNTETGDGTTSKNKSNGNYQAIFGKENIATKVEGQFLAGTFTDVNNDTLFAIGNGTNLQNRSNAFTVNTDGKMIISGSFNTPNISTNYIVLNNSITDNSNDKYAATKKYVFDKVSAETTRATNVENTLSTNLNNEITRAKAEEDSIRAIASSAFHFKGTKDSYDDLPKTGNKQGDVWQVGDKEYAWNGSEWVELGFNIDLSPYAKITYVDTRLATKVDNNNSGANSLINKLSIEESLPTGNDYFISQYAGGGTTTTTYHRRKISTLYDYIVNYSDKTVTSGSTKLITSGAVYTGLSGKQNTLVSGTNIKTINGNSILGSGNIEIQGGGGSTVTVDNALSTTSTNPVQNKIIANALNSKQDNIGIINSTIQALVLDNKIKSIYSDAGDFTINSTSGYLKLSSLSNLILSASNIASINLDSENDVIVDTIKYHISWDVDDEAIKITFKN